MRITAIERDKRRRRYRLTIEGARTLYLSPDVVVEAGLRHGIDIDEQRLAGLELAEARHSAMASALRLLSYRQRTRKELRDALQKRKFATAVVDETIDRLTHLGLINDREFAAYWTDSRMRNSPRSRRMLLAELAAKGVTGQIAIDTVVSIDDGQAAIDAARKRARTLSDVTYDQFRRKIGDFLARRGFDYEVCSAAIQRLWEERHAEQTI